MNAMTCQQVEEQLDLLAAGECDRSTRRAVERHLDDCPTCSASYYDSQQLQGMLNLHWNEAEQLQRLHRRIDAAARQPRQPRRTVLPFVRRVASLAALLLVTLGLALLLPKWSEPSDELAMSAVPVRGGLELKADHIPAPPRAIGEAAVARFGEKGLELSRVKSRQELGRLKRAGKLPPPPKLPLGLELMNRGVRPLDVQLGGAAYLSLDINGPGVLRLPAPAEVNPSASWPKSLRLAPGEHRWLPLERLVAGSSTGVDYVYLTEPGEYTLTLRLRVTIDRIPTLLTSETIRIRVRAD